MRSSRDSEATETYVGAIAETAARSSDEHYSMGERWWFRTLVSDAGENLFLGSSEIQRSRCLKFGAAEPRSISARRVALRR